MSRRTIRVLAVAAAGVISLLPMAPPAGSAVTGTADLYLVNGLTPAEPGSSITVCSAGPVPALLGPAGIPSGASARVAVVSTGELRLEVHLGDVDCGQPGTPPAAVAVVSVGEVPVAAVVVGSAAAPRIVSIAMQGCLDLTEASPTEVGTVTPGEVSPTVFGVAVANALPSGNVTYLYQSAAEVVLQDDEFNQFEVSTASFQSALQNTVIVTAPATAIVVGIQVAPCAPGIGSGDEGSGDDGGASSAVPPATSVVPARTVEPSFTG